MAAYIIKLILNQNKISLKFTIVGSELLKYLIVATVATS